MSADLKRSLPNGNVADIFRGVFIIVPTVVNFDVLLFFVLLLLLAIDLLTTAFFNSLAMTSGGNGELTPASFTAAMSLPVCFKTRASRVAFESSSGASGSFHARLSQALQQS